MEQKTLLLTKRSSFTGKIGQQKGAVAFSLAVAVAASILAVVLALFTNDLIFSIAQPLLFLVAGALHYNRMLQDLPVLTPTERWLYSLCIAATILLLLGCSWFWGAYLQVITLLAGPGAFLLPLALAELWRLYVKISFAEPKVWKLTTEMDETYPAIYITGIPLRFKIIDEEAEDSAGIIQARALQRMRLSEAFCDTVQKQNKKGEQGIALTDAEQRPTRWIFYTNDMVIWKRTLDPNLSIIKNNLKRNAVVYAQRLRDEENDLPNNELN